MNYKKMNKQRLLRAFEIKKRAWKSLPKKSSFSGLHISGELEEIQQIMEARGYDFKEFVVEVNMFGYKEFVREN
jgi:hypothetical protein